MFSSSNIGNPSSQPNSLISNDLLMDHLLAINSCTSVTKQVTNSSNAALLPIKQAQKDRPATLPTKRAVKKDRHSKIHTAQGLRDRRVRLSIGIARKFFDLQDMLGFDKASRTLEWLLTKSNMAIDELTQMKHRCSAGAKRLPPTCKCKENCGDMKERYNLSVSKEREMEHSHNFATHTFTKESRARARARAKERTKQKIYFRRKIKEKEWISQSSHSISNVEESVSDFDVYDVMPSLEAISPIREVEEPSTKSLSNQVYGKDNLEQSLVIKRKLKPPPVLSYQQNLVISKVTSSKNNNINSKNNFLPTSPQNWDSGGSIAFSSLCSRTNMNSLTGKTPKLLNSLCNLHDIDSTQFAEFQVYGRPWESFIHQSLP